MAHRQTDRVLPLIEEFIRRQYAANAGATLAQLLHVDPARYRVHPDLPRFLAQERQEVGRLLRAELADVSASECEGLVRQFVTGTQAHIQRHNQFISLRPRDRADLAALYADYLADMAGMLASRAGADGMATRLETTIHRHLLTLQAFVARLDAANRHGDAGLLDRSAVCAEYPAPLQLAVLGLDPSSMQEPVLDVGCGQGAALVRYLRDVGVTAYGLDRLVPPSDHLIAGDWLEADYGAACWGTAVSHLAFSNHFYFHHLYRHGAPEAYARAYMAILRSLRVGGALAYAPGLPFIEGLLPPARYRVVTRPVPMPRHLGLLGSASSGVARSAFTATQVIRLA